MHRILKSTLFHLGLIGLFCFSGAQASDEELLFVGGDILTMAGQAPEYVDALLVRDGRISFAGSVEDASKKQGASVKVIDLKGQTLLPGFIDSHSHFLMTASKLSTVALDPPPAGAVRSIADILALLKQELESNPRREGQWLLGWGFDNGMLADKRFPTRADLDEVSAEVPIMIMHFSGHMLVITALGWRAQVTDQTINHLLAAMCREIKAVR